VEILAKNSKETMMKDEMKVLDVLEQHAKDNVDKIAKKCGFSRQKVWKIIKNLEENKIIWGYSAITDAEEKNLKHFILLVKRTTLPFDDKMKKEMGDTKLDEYFPVPSFVKTDSIYVTHGNYDWALTFYAPDIVAAKTLLNAFSSKFAQYIKEYLLLETLFPVRKNSFTNPQIKELIQYL
jgi:DNA-binding Lrp family transcriptional regulator